MPNIYIATNINNENKRLVCESEKSHILNYVKSMLPYLDANGIEYFCNMNSDVLNSIEDCNNGNYDLYYAPCTDVAEDPQSRFSIIKVYSIQPSSGGYKCADKMRKYRESIYPRSIFIKQSRSDVEIIKTKPPAIIDSIVVNNNTEDAKLFRENINDFARQTVRSFCDYFGIAYKDPIITKKNDFTTDYKESGNVLNNKFDNLITENKELKRKILKIRAELGKIIEELY